MKKLMAGAVLLLLARGEARAQETSPKWLGGQVYQENDSLLQGDERYTQGLRISVVRAGNPKKIEDFGDKRLGGLLWSKSRKFFPNLAVVFGQNMYTPEIITVREPYSGDRGFAGVLYGGAQVQFTDADQIERHTFEAYVGLTGEGSLAGPAQQGLHVLRFRRIPKGWKDAPDRVVANTYYRLERRVEWCNSAEPRLCFADVTLGGLASLGNIQTAAGLHGALRVGYGLTGFPAASIANAAAPLARPSKLEVGAILGWEGRALAYNGLLRPSLASDDFSIERIVRDTRYGGYARFKDFRLTVLQVRRSPEFSVAGGARRGQRFASISASYEPLEAPERGKRSILLRDWHLELGLGAAPLGPRLEGRGRRHGPAAKVGIAKGLFWELVGGFELGGVVVEDEPPTAEPDTHNDTFLIHRALFLGWKPHFAKGRLLIRAGPTLFGQVGKVETTQNRLVVGGRPTEDRTARYYQGGRRGWIAGAQYTLPLAQHLALGAAATYSHLRFPEGFPGIARPDYLTAALVLEVRP